MAGRGIDRVSRVSGRRPARAGPVPCLRAAVLPGGHAPFRAGGHGVRARHRHDGHPRLPRNRGRSAQWFPGPRAGCRGAGRRLPPLHRGAPADRCDGCQQPPPGRGKIRCARRQPRHVRPHAARPCRRGKRMILKPPSLKRCFDLLVASVLLVLLMPVLLLVAVLVARKLGRPVLFRQTRPGMDGKPFTMIKFRTMRDAVDAHGRPLPDSERLGRFGQLLRASSADELPELWNVLRGDMSLVGPRPLLMEYLPLYSAEQARRHEVRPGMTGLAQVSGRNALTWEEKFRLDARYVEHYSLPLDMKLLMQTVRAVVTARGVSAEGSATMPAFTGTVSRKESPGGNA